MLSRLIKKRPQLNSDYNRNTIIEVAISEEWQVLLVILKERRNSIISLIDHHPLRNLRCVSLSLEEFLNRKRYFKG